MKYSPIDANKNWAIALMVFIGFSQMAIAQKHGTFTDERDGHKYEWIKIGEQRWMAENLAFLPKVYPVGDNQFDVERYYVTGFDGSEVDLAKATDNYKRYGVLYNWVAACNSCPNGWRLPTDEEWKVLERNLGMSEEESGIMFWRRSGNVGEKLKSKENWKINEGRDDLGFGVVPAGCRGYRPEYHSEGFCAYFWTASPAGTDNGWRRGFCCDDVGISRDEDRRYFGLSVRCIKK